MRFHRPTQPHALPFPAFTGSSLFLKNKGDSVKAETYLCRALSYAERVFGPHAPYSQKIRDQLETIKNNPSQLPHCSLGVVIPFEALPQSWCRLTRRKGGQVRDSKPVALSEQTLERPTRRFQCGNALSHTVSTTCRSLEAGLAPRLRESPIKGKSMAESVPVFSSRNNEIGAWESNRDGRISPVSPEPTGCPRCPVASPPLRPDPGRQSSRPA